MYFLESDLANFERYRYDLDDAVKKGRLDPIFDIFSVYKTRAHERIEHARGLLTEEPDFTVDEDYLFDRADATWAGDRAELNEIWRKRVKNDVLSLHLAGKT